MVILAVGLVVCVNSQSVPPPRNGVAYPGKYRYQSSPSYDVGINLRSNRALADKLQKYWGSLKFPINDEDVAADMDVLSICLVYPYSDPGTRPGGMALLDWCLERGADINARSGAPLKVVVTEDPSGNVVETMLKKGANPNLTTKNKPTPLMLSITRKSDGKDYYRYDGPKTTEVLLRYGANANTASPEIYVSMNAMIPKEGFPYYTPLTAAVRHNRVEAMQVLLKYKADVNGAEPATGRTALHIAALRKNAEAVQVLLRAKADKKIKDKGGKTAYDLAKGAKATSKFLKLLKP
ncbi:MAG: ankyrin repeat domain-containing protein [Fimbriimonadaceae bacterium]